MNLRSWKVAAVAGALALAAAGGGLAAVNVGGSTPAQVRLITPSGDSGSTTTTTPALDTTTTFVTATAPATTLAPVSTTLAPVTVPPATTSTTNPDVTVPNVVGDTYSQARAAVEAATLHFESMVSCNSPNSNQPNPSAVVISQAPPGGTQLPRSNGFVTVSC